MSRGSSTIIPLFADALVYSTDRTAGTESITITAISRSAFTVRHLHKNVIVGIWEKENRKYPSKIREKKSTTFSFFLGSQILGSLSNDTFERRTSTPFLKSPFLKFSKTYVSKLVTMAT